MSKGHQSDLGAAYRGLLLGAVAVVIICFSIVKIVNATMSKPTAGHVVHD